MLHSPRPDNFLLRSMRAFSLIEILAAVAVLSLLGLMIVQITSAVRTTTRLSLRAIDASAQARLAFERLSADLTLRVKRPDVDFHADNSGNSETLLFLSGVTSSDPASAPSGFKNRGSSYVSYEVAAHPDNGGRPCLVRGSRALGWTDAGYVGLKSNGRPIQLSDSAFPNSVLPKAPSATSPGEYDLLAPGVIRLVVGFQLYPDNRSVTLENGTVLNNAQGQIVYSPPIRTDTGTAVYIDLSRVSALVVGLVAADVESLKLLKDTQITALATPFALPATNQLPVAAWNTLANTPSNFSAIPLPAVQSLRVYQRFYPINPFPNPPK